MLILLDIGNTAITYGRYENSRLAESGSCLYDAIPKLLKKWSNSGKESRNVIVISSVVPSITQKIKKSLRGWEVLIPGQNLPINIKNRYKSPKKLGIDRLVNVYGALQMYGKPALVIDYGTAITFDLVSKAGIFEGGMIIPGPQVAFQSLIEKAALLPKKVRLPKKAGAFLGRDTYECMSSGILEGYGALSDGLIERFKSRYGKNLKVIVTGGFACHLKPYARHFHKVDPLHSIQSLFLLYNSKK